MPASVIVNQPGVYLVDSDGNLMTVEPGSAIPANAEGIVIIGKDSSGDAQIIKVASDGTLAISAVSLPLPTGAATQTTLASLEGKDFATQTTLATLATESKLEAVRVLLATIDADTSSLAAEDFATETTLATLATETKLEAVRVLLASIDGKDFATQTTLAAIKDTDGVADLGKWLGSAAPTVGQKAMVASVPVTLASDQPAIPITQGAPSPADSIRDFCKNGGSRDMNVDGSGTAVTFTFPADATDDIEVFEVRLVMNCASIVMDADDFGSDNALTNGLLIEATSDGSTFTLGNFTINEDFLAAPGRVLSTYDGPSGDQLVASFDFGGRLQLLGGTADEIKVTVRDELTSGSAHKVKLLWCVVFGKKV